MSKYGSLFLPLLFSSSLYANAVEIVGEVPVKISTTSNLNKSLSVSKTIVVQKLQLSPAAKMALKGRIDELQGYGNQPSLYKTTAAVRINLGMNKTPVLDQGQHGTCVTFAMAGALDALMGYGDYVSSLCSLQLGNYLVRAKLASYSGWDGSWGTAVFNQLKKYGMVTKAYQVKYGCPSGVKQYPLSNNANITKAMSIAQYTAVSRPLGNITGLVLADSNAVFSPNFNATALLEKVKQQLRSGRRVVIGFLLDDNQGSAGAVGTKAKRFDSWVINASILKKAKAGSLYSGHEIIVVGYDDTALIRGSDGRLSKGLFILRNSWGPYAGDNGNYYMSYEYFKYLVDEATALYRK
ncbi:C1 family peptidase [Legionella sp. km772]|uniref:C1 family peptidase n=1 Tax=Legionella sp. km772 TaxID=2498111 RepID=UPI000F8DAC04|nr:C1 family peptidase [Legionella sp. km772]RUR06312.1 peptidase C1 [Legionella sp. km772]